jgi:hypothetical protein
MPTDRYGTPIYDPDDEPVFCVHGVQQDAPWWCRETCNDCAVDQCAADDHRYTGDVQDDDGIWWESCECGEMIRPLAEPWSPDDDGKVEAER